MKNFIEGKKSNEELSPEEKEIAKSLVDMSFLSLKEKADVILAWRKLKRASSFFIKPETADAELEKMKEIMKKARIFFKITDGKDPNNPDKVCLISKKQKDLEILFRIWFGDHINDPEVYKAMGRISGFPETAVSAFDQTHNPSTREKTPENKFLLSLDEMKQKTPRELYPFVQFRLSRENWRTELETAKKWADEIKLVNPKFYDILLKQEF